MREIGERQFQWKMGTRIAPYIYLLFLTTTQVVPRNVRLCCKKIIWRSCFININPTKWLCSNQWRLYPGSQVRPLTGLESTRKGQGFIIQVGTFEMSPVQVSLEVWSCLSTVHWYPMKITLHVRTFLKENWNKKKERERARSICLLRMQIAIPWCLTSWEEFSNSNIYITCEIEQGLE